MIGSLKALYAMTCSAVAPRRYERRKARTVGFSYPDYFDRTRSIFIHVPKAAGTSISMALYGRAVGHTTWRQWQELSPYKFRRYFKFGVVREPVARFLSAFDFLKQGGMNSADQTFNREVLAPFADADTFAKALVDPGLQARVLPWIHFQPQSYFVADADGNCRLDMLIRFEDLPEAMRRVLGRLGMERSEIPRMNVTRERANVELRGEALEVVRAIYREDFPLWESAGATS